MTDQSTLINITEKKPPKVSIGMPVYNGEKYIQDALNSLLEQTFSNFELIISDNCSTDGTAKICQEYALRDNRIIYHQQKTNIGAAANFGFVLDSACAPIFMWAAHDDKWTKGFLYNAMETLNEESIDFAFPSFKLKSIRLKITKKFNREVFDFVSSHNKRERVLEFLALHHDSHKCNIVYSVVRTEVLRSAHKLQNISNDGALGCVLLSLGRGGLVMGEYFIKRYNYFWPGIFSWFYAYYHKNNSTKFNNAKESALTDLSKLFPEYIKEITEIFNKYQPFTFSRSYQICEVYYALEKVEQNDK